jgi:hypothetical protein
LGGIGYHRPRNLSDVIENEANRFGIKMNKPKDFTSMLNVMKRQTRFRRKAPQIVFDEIDKEITEQAGFISEQKRKEEVIHIEFINNIEYRATINTAKSLLGIGKGVQNEDEKDNFDNENPPDEPYSEKLLEGSGAKINYICGTILQTEKVRLQRLIFRATRGKAMIYLKDIKQPIIDYQGRKLLKSVYIVISEHGEYLTEKLKRILDSFMGNRFDLQKDTLVQEYLNVSKKILEMRETMKRVNSELK